MHVKTVWNGVRPLPFWYQLVSAVCVCVCLRPPICSMYILINCCNGWKIMKYAIWIHECSDFAQNIMWNWNKKGAFFQVHNYLGENWNGVTVQDIRIIQSHKIRQMIMMMMIPLVIFVIFLNYILLLWVVFYIYELYFTSASYILFLRVKLKLNELNLIPRVKLFLSKLNFLCTSWISFCFVVVCFPKLYFACLS